MFTLKRKIPCKFFIYKGLTLYFVTPTGFKPVTAGAEIQCAIQLRHGAFFWRVVQILKGQLRHGASLSIRLKIQSTARQS